MSSLLERAIIDANALKQAALKNAENMVIEKYSQEIKSAMATLLEQDDLGLGADLGMGTDPVADTGMGLGGEFDPITDDDPLATGETTEEPIDPNAQPTIDKDSVAAQLPDSFETTPGDDQLIKIKLDALEAEFEDEPGSEGLFGGDNELEDDEISIDITDLEDEELENINIGDEEMEIEDDEQVDIDISPDTISEIISELDLEDDLDISIDDIKEALKVDIDPDKSGWAGTPESIMREYEAMLLAKENDDEVKEKNEKLRKRVKDLQKENKTLSSTSLKLNNQNKKYVEALETLHEKLEQVNVSNAKLLYINQTLENTSLNERQKRKLVEAISKAGTIGEAKIIYETLQDTVKNSLASNSQVNSLSEAVTRKSTLLMAGRRQEEEVSANPFFNRMQKLAGINKTN